MEFPNVMIEKANAIRRYRMKRNLATALRFFNLCVALFIFSRSSVFPTTLRLFSHFYTELVSLLNHPFYVFLLGNLIILSIYALSDKNHPPNDVYDEFLTNTVDSSHHKQTTCSVPAESISAVTETTKTRTRTRTTTTSSSCTRTVNGKKVAKSKCYRRVESERLERWIVGPSRELKRMKTEVSREVVRYGGESERRLCAVENLSNEDFNRTVEDFIAKHRRMQWEEHREFQKTENFALTQ